MKCWLRRRVDSSGPECLERHKQQFLQRNKWQRSPQAHPGYLFSNHVPPSSSFLSYIERSRCCTYLGRLMAASMPDIPAPMQMTFNGRTASILRSDMTDLEACCVSKGILRSNWGRNVRHLVQGLLFWLLPHGHDWIVPHRISSSPALGSRMRRTSPKEAMC